MGCKIMLSTRTSIIHTGVNCHEIWVWQIIPAIIIHSSYLYCFIFPTRYNPVSMRQEFCTGYNAVMDLAGHQDGIHYCWTIPVKNTYEGSDYTWAVRILGLYIMHWSQSHHSFSETQMQTRGPTCVSCLIAGDVHYLVLQSAFVFLSKKEWCFWL